jgi:PKD repeat protein
VRSVPTWLAGASFRWEYLDGGWAQYSARKGQVDGYRDAQVRAANDEGLKVVWGMNILDGGDGSSGTHFNSSTKYSMSASEVLKYGKALMAASNSCGFLMWMYQSDYMASSGILDAMKTLSAEAKTHASSCGDAGGSVPEAPAPPATENVAPVASFTGICTDLSCAFTNTSQDSDGSIANWKWDFGDGVTSDQANPQPHPYAAAGDYTVALTVTDDKGATNVASKVFTAEDPSVAVPTENLSPAANFTVTCSSLTCSFNDTSSDPDGIIVTRSWSFGNGSTSASSSPERTYAAAGTYTVTLTVTDNDGATGTTTQSVTVSASTTNVAPAAYFGSACTKLSCAFTDRSKDSDGTIVAWSWSFGDGTGSTARNPSHAFKAGGTYKVKLTVTDNAGGTDPITHSVTVAP